MTESDTHTAFSEASQRFSEDWLANLLGGILLLISLTAVLTTLPEQHAGSTHSASTAPESISNPLSPFLAKPINWTGNPWEAWHDDSRPPLWLGIIGVFAVSLGVFGLGVRAMGQSWSEFVRGFWCVFLLALIALTIAANTTVKQYNLEYALWALATGLLISNTIGTPAFVRPAILTEFYIKTGLVLYGAKVLFGALLELGPPGLCVAWVVTPVVLITTYWFGQRVLNIASRRLNIVISADMSVCGVSAAIATAAACRAKKEELTLAIGISLSFTVVMMVVMPAVRMRSVVTASLMPVKSVTTGT